MQLRTAIALTLLAGASCHYASAQAARRIAVIEMNGQLARTNAAFAFAENRVTDMLNSKLAGRPGITLVDRASIERIIKEQDFQNSDRSSSATAAKIGKILGVSQVVLVNVYSGGYTTHPETSGSKTRVMGTQTLRVNVRLEDVESAAILVEPAADFQDTVLVSETSKTQGFQFGQIRVPPKQSSSGGDPAVIQEGEWNKACDFVTSDLAAKLTTAIAGAPRPKTPPALVAGIAGGNVYINKGSSSGVKSGDSYQVVRQVDTGLKDPSTNQPILQRQTICVLTILNVNDTNASGSCKGGLPQSKDLAEPSQP